MRSRDSLSVALIVRSAQFWASRACFRYSSSLSTGINSRSSVYVPQWQKGPPRNSKGARGDGKGPVTKIKAPANGGFQDKERRALLGVVHYNAARGLSGFLLFVLLYALTTMTFATYVPEIFPTTLRLTGCGISNATGRVANIAAPFGIAGLLTAIGPRAVFYAAAVILTMQALAVMVFGEETRGRSLEEIENLARPDIS